MKPLHLLIVVAILLPAGQTHAADFRAGVAVVDITGPRGYRMSGYFSERLNTGTHDPLHAKAMYLRQGDTEAALVFCDLIGMAPQVAAKARTLASKQTGVPVAHILVAATHSHTGPLYFGALRNHFHSRAVAEHGSDPYEKVNYKDKLIEGIARAVLQAKKAAKPVSLAAGVGQQDGLSFNRRFHMKDGTVRFNPGKLNPNIVKVAGPIDPDVGVLRLSNKAGKPFASLTVFALHLDTVGGTEYSADYPFHLSLSLKQKYGDAFVSLFGTGTCGDINHIDVSHNRPQKGQVEAKRIGDALAETVRAKLPALDKVSAPKLAVRRAVFDAPLQKYSDEQIAWAKQAIEKVDVRGLPFLERVKAYKIMALQWRGGDTMPVEVQAFRLGDNAAIVGLPGEVFVDLGVAIKKASPFKTTLVIELCNDAPGYVPTEKAFREGSYETVNSRIAPGGGEKMADAAIGLLKALHAD